MTCSPVPLSFQTTGDHWMTEDELKFLHKDVDLHNRRKLSGGRGGGEGESKKQPYHLPARNIKSIFDIFICKKVGKLVSYSLYFIGDCCQDGTVREDEDILNR